MKTDKIKLIDLFTEFGLGFRNAPEQVGFDKKIHSAIALEAGNNMNKIEGYGGFIAVFNFDKNEQFISLGVWE